MEHEQLARSSQVLDLVEQSRLAHAGLTRHDHKLALTAIRGIEPLLQLSQLLLSADERRECHTRQHQGLCHDHRFGEVAVVQSRLAAP